MEKEGVIIMGKLSSSGGMDPENIWPQKKVLTIVLIAANLLVFGMAIFTIPPHFQKGVGKANIQVALDADSPADLPLSEAADRLNSNSENQAGGAATQAFSTEERPGLDDFLWYVEGVLNEGLPPNVATIDQVEALLGSWKAFILYDPNLEHNSAATEFLNINLTGSPDDLTLIFDWYQIIWLNEGQVTDETDMENTVFKGKWGNRGLEASGTGTIHLTDFYEKDQKQYAIGTMDTPTGIPAFIAMVRP